MAGFKDIVGNEQIIEHLQNAISMGKVSHAYIINGPQLSGKMTISVQNTVSSWYFLFCFSFIVPPLLADCIQKLLVFFIKQIFSGKKLVGYRLFLY